jgi:hypothetical protein
MPAADEPLLSLLGFLAAVVVIFVDGRNAVGIAALAAGLCLAPLAAETTGTAAALILIGAGLAAAVAGPLSRALAGRVSWMAGLDPVVPVVTPEESLFGPRSIRVACGVAVLPAASWVSFNVPLGTAATVNGILFPAAIVWACAAVRLLTARTIIDVAVGVAGVGIAGAAGWLATGAAETVVGALAAGSLAPAMALTAGWLGGRHAAAGRPA